MNKKQLVEMMNRILVQNETGYRLYNYLILDGKEGKIKGFDCMKELEAYVYQLPEADDIGSFFVLINGEYKEVFPQYAFSSQTDLVYVSAYEFFHAREYYYFYEGYRLKFELPMIAEFYKDDTEPCCFIANAAGDIYRILVKGVLAEERKAGEKGTVLFRNEAYGYELIEEYKGSVTIELYWRDNRDILYSSGLCCFKEREDWCGDRFILDKELYEESNDLPVIKSDEDFREFVESAFDGLWWEDEEAEDEGLFPSFCHLYENKRKYKEADTTIEVADAVISSFLKAQQELLNTMKDAWMNR